MRSYFRPISSVIISSKATFCLIYWPRMKLMFEPILGRPKKEIPQEKNVCHNKYKIVFMNCEQKVQIPQVHLLTDRINKICTDQQITAASKEIWLHILKMKTWLVTVNLQLASVIFTPVFLRKICKIKILFTFLSSSLKISTWKSTMLVNWKFNSLSPKTDYHPFLNVGKAAAVFPLDSWRFPLLLI